MKIQLATHVDESQAELFRNTTARLGTTPADALRMFVAAFNECGGFPFDVRVPVRPVAEPFATESEANERIAQLNRRVIDEAW